MTYSIPYIILLTLFGLCAFLYEKTENEEKRQHITLFSITLFFLFFAFRGYIYSDWVIYSESFKYVEWEDIFSITNTKTKAVIHEPGFTALMWLCSLVTREYAFLVIIITTIDTFLFVRFLRRWNVKNIAFAFMLFITFGGIGLMFNALRNQLAIFIFLNALEYIYEKKALRYFSLCFLALCFHASSIIFFPLYFFLGRKINKWVFLSLFIGFFLFYISQISILQIIISATGMGGALGEKATLYTETYATARALSPTGTLEKMGLTLLVFLYYGKMTEDKTTILLINSLILYYFFYYVFGEFRELSSRLSLIFGYSYWVLWIRLMRVFSIQNNRRLYGGIFFLYCLYVTSLAYKLPIQEYDNLLLGGKSQTERMKIFYKTYEDDN